MTRPLSRTRFELVSISSLGFVLAAGACDSSQSSDGPAGTAGANPSAGAASAGAPGQLSAGAPGSTGSTAGSGSGSVGAAGGSLGASYAGGATGGGATGNPNTAGSGGALVSTPLPPLVTSALGAYWKTDGALTDSTAAATVTVNEAASAQTWEGFGAAFNELGWSVLTTSEMQTQALKLLFSASEGAAFLWGRIPMGASDYAISRYTNDDTGADPVPNGESNRPAADPELVNFSLARDNEKLIPYIKAAQAVKPELRFWASPWTPPVWMKTGFKTDDGSSTGTAKRASFYDGGTVSNTYLAAYAKYYTKFVQGYKDKGINIELVSPQNEPGYDQNYPSALWDAATYTAWIGQHLGPAMNALGVKVMLGTLSNTGDRGRTDLDLSSAVLADANAKRFLSVVGVQWGVLAKVVEGTTFSDLPIWATEHKCGNYPWCKPEYPCTYIPNYVSSQAPNDQAYGVESWGYIRDAISKGKVTSYNAWNMVLDKHGLGNDTSREWKQNALLVADSGKVTPTPAYHVFRHLSQYVTPGATVVGTTGGDALAFKNPDASLVLVLFNSGAANANYVVAFGAKKFQFAMPGNGWATLKYKP